MKLIAVGLATVEDIFPDFRETSDKKFVRDNRENKSLYNTVFKKELNVVSSQFLDETSVYKLDMKSLNVVIYTLWLRRNGILDRKIRLNEYIDLNLLADLLKSPENELYLTVTKIEKENKTTFKKEFSAFECREE